ncbi:MAG: hypothetical protein ABFD91_00060 [Anaerohalosphaeraceae bacterium]
MKRIIMIAVAIGSLGLLGGCEPKDKWSYHYDIERRYVTIVTEPEGAIVQQIDFNGPTTMLGTSPIIEQPVVVMSKIKKANNLSYTQSMEMMRRVGTIYVTIHKEGFQPYQGFLRTEPDETRIHQITLQAK